MKLSRASRYAIHAVVYLASRKTDALVGAQEIAQLLGITENRLIRILKSLVAARILWSLRGPGGGYRLVRPAARLSLLDIIEGVDGPIRSVVAPMTQTSHEIVESRLGAICEQLDEWIRNVLGKIVIADLLEKSERSFRAVLPLQRPEEEAHVLPPEVAEGLERIRKLMDARDGGLGP